MILVVYSNPIGLVTVLHAKEFTRPKHAQNFVQSIAGRYPVIKSIEAPVSLVHKFDWEKELAL